MGIFYRRFAPAGDDGLLDPLQIGPFTSRLGRLGCRRLPGSLFLRCGQILHAERVPAQQHVREENCPAHLPYRGVHNGAGQAALNRHGQKQGVDGCPVRQAEGDVGEPQCQIDAQFVPNELNGLKGFQTGLIVGADGHGQGVDDDVFPRDADLFRAFHNPPGDGEPLFCGLGDAAVVHGEPDDRGPVLLDQGKDLFQFMRFTVDRIDQGLSLAHREACGQGLGEGRVDAEGGIRDLLDRQDRLPKHIRFVNAGHAHIDIQDIRTLTGLAQGLGSHQAEVPLLQGLCQSFPAGRVDPLADDDQGS